MPETLKNLVLLHGALGSRKQMESLKNILSNEYRILNPDLYGHGLLSEMHHDFGIPLMAHDLEKFLTENELTNVHVFGYSMGGYVALFHNILYPDRINKIICLGTKFHWTPLFAAHETQNLKPSWLSENAPKFAQLLQKRHGDFWSQMVNQTAQMMLNLGEQPLLDNLLLSKVKASCLILRGDQDTMVNAEETQWAARCIPKAVTGIVEQSPHAIEKVDLTKMIKFMDFFKD